MGSETLPPPSDPDEEYVPRSTRLVMLFKNIYSLWGRKCFLLPPTYFSTNIGYPFSVRVTGIKILKSLENGIETVGYGSFTARQTFAQNYNTLCKGIKSF